MKSREISEMLDKAVKNFCAGHFEESWKLILSLNPESLSEKNERNLHKILNLLILGELFELHNLSQLLFALGLDATTLYRNWKKLSHRQILDLVNHCFAVIVRDRLRELCRKSESTWSRKKVTLVLDSSIYKQILSRGKEHPEFDKFFSGQVNATVWGFRLTLIGLAIDDIFYPISFYISSKQYSEGEVAAALLRQVSRMLKLFKEQENLDFPNLYLSVDGAFCKDEIFELCEKQLGIIPISVPRRNWKFEIDGETTTLSGYINQLLEQEAEGNEDVFPHRKRAHREQFGEVVLLFFRLKKGKKINIIMTTKLEISAKTLRRRWFQRTYIEQFFRFSKHTLRIQQTRSTNPEEFCRKAAINFLKIVVCQAFTRYCQKNFKPLKNYSFHKIRDVLKRQGKHDFIEQILLNYDDLLQETCGVT